MRVHKWQAHDTENALRTLSAIALLAVGVPLTALALVNHALVWWADLTNTSIGSFVLDVPSLLAAALVVLGLAFVKGARDVWDGRW